MRPTGVRSAVTLVELLVAVGVASLLTALALPLVLSTRDAVALDQARTAANQTLRAVTEMIGADVRVAGQYVVGEAVSAIQVATAADGSSELTLIAFAADALPVCEPLNGQQAQFKVAEWGGNGAGGGNASGNANAGNVAYPQCAAADPPFVDRDGTEWPSEALAEVARAAAAAGGTLAAWIVAPDGTSQWFSMSVPAPAPGQAPSKVRCEGDCRWQTRYGPEPTGAGAFAYVRAGERVTYRLRDGVLERVQGVDDAVVRIASGVARFDVTVTLADGQVRSAFGADDAWQSIASVDVDLSVVQREGARTVVRDLALSLLPRNVLSR